MAWRHLRADDCDWEVRLLSGAAEGVDPKSEEILEFQPTGAMVRGARRTVIAAGTYESMSDDELLAAYRRARPIAGDHYGRPGKRMPDSR